MGRGGKGGGGREGCRQGWSDQKREDDYNLQQFQSTSMKKILEIKTIQLLTPTTTSHRPQSSPAARRSSPDRTIETNFTECPSQQGVLRGSKRLRRSLTKQQQRKKSSTPHEQPNSRIHHNPEFRLSSDTPHRNTRTRYQDHGEQKIPRTHSHHRYETKLTSSDQEADYPTLRVGKKKHNLRQNMENMLMQRGRLNSQPCGGALTEMKQDIMQRISKKIDFMKKMNPQAQPSPLVSAESASLFKFDRLYDYCLKKINKCINVYEKDLTRSRDKKYYELKIEGSILSKELRLIRSSLVRKKEGDGEQQMMGVIGSEMGIAKAEGRAESKGQPTSQRASNSAYKRKVAKITKEMSLKPKQHQNDIHGWQFGLEKTQDFDL